MWCFKLCYELPQAFVELTPPDPEHRVVVANKCSPEHSPLPWSPRKQGINVNSFRNVQSRTTHFVYLLLWGWAQQEHAVFWVSWGKNSQFLIPSAQKMFLSPLISIQHPSKDVWVVISGKTLPPLESLPYVTPMYVWRMAFKNISLVFKYKVKTVMKQRRWFSGKSVCCTSMITWVWSPSTP